MSTPDYSCDERKVVFIKPLNDIKGILALTVFLTEHFSVIREERSATSSI